MRCPHCNSENNIVLNSRKSIHNTQVWRRRKCLICQSIYTTHELADLSHIIVVKKDGSKERFNKLKLYAGIHGAVVQRWIQGSREELAMKYSTEVEGEILKLKLKEIKSTEISEICLSILSKRDLTVFLRFYAYNKHPDSLKNLKKDLAKYLSI